MGKYMDAQDRDKEEEVGKEKGNTRQRRIGERQNGER